MQTKLTKIFICILITLSLLAYSYAPSRTTPTQLPPLAAPRTSVLLMPLDSRPVCSTLPQKLGQLAGLNVILPPKAYLDNYKTPANKEKLWQWLAYNQKFYSTSLISADILLHGSLLEARQSIATPKQEAELINALASLNTNPDTTHAPAASKALKSCTIFSVIPRLLVSDELLPDRWYQYQLLCYSELADMVRISGSYALTQKLHEVEAKIPPKVLQKYLSQYQQSDSFNTRLLSLAGSQKNLQLVFGQDDASPIGLPHASASRLQELIRSHSLQPQAQLTYGADEIASLLIAKAYLQQAHWQPRIYLKFSTPKTEQKQMPYMAVSTGTAVRNQLQLIGGRLAATEAEADIILYIHCGDDNALPTQQEAEQLHKLLTAPAAKAKKIALIDLSANFEANEMLLPVLLSEDVPVNKLAAYAGWNTFSNSSGTAIAQAVIFTGRLRQLEQAQATSEQLAALYAANLNFTIERMLEDYYYQKCLHPGLRTTLTSLGISPTDLSPDEKQQTEYYIQKRLSLYAELLLWRNLKRTPFYSSPAAGYYLKNLTVGAKLPWNRIFEVDLQVWTQLGTSSKENKQVSR